jgi:Fe-S oxidoreductase
MAQQELTRCRSAIVIDDEVWQELVELTDGAAGPCFQCGACTAVCPWGLVRDESPSIRTLIRQAQLGLSPSDQTLWLCTACGECQALCPRGVDVPAVIRGLRYLAWERRSAPHGLPSVLWSVYWNNNPLAQPPSLRSRWADLLQLPAFDAREHEILFYAGCTSSYDRRAQKIARALVRLLQAAGVPFGYLGDDEPCCGESVLSLGHPSFFHETVGRAAATFKEKGVRKLVTISPHCYDVFKNHWPDPGFDLEALHYTQYLASLIDSGRLKLELPVEAPVTYHDACYLARHNGETAAPRRVLEAIPNLTLVEMGRHGQDALCCGGGGGRMYLETEAGQRFADQRLQEAMETGASLLATACPFCVACLEDSLSAQNRAALAVMDVAEIAAMALARPQATRAGSDG